MLGRWGLEALVEHVPICMLPVCSWSVAYAHAPTDSLM